MLEILRDPLWQAIGVALAIAALATSFLIYSWQRSRRSVTYDVISWTHLLTVREELAGKVQVLYEGEEAKSLTLITIKVWNSGNQPLLASDFERPIAFRIEQGSQILTAAVLETDPPGVAAELEQYSDGIVLKPALINPADSITIKLLVKDMGKIIWPDARITGVKAVTLFRESTRPGLALGFAALVFVGISAYFIVASLPARGERPMFGNSIYFGLIALAIGFACLLSAEISLRRARRRNARLKRPGRSGA